MRHLVRTLGVLTIIALASPVWAESVTVPCTINHDGHALFSDSWDWRACRTDLPSLDPYAVLEVTFDPITSIAPSVGWSQTCHHGTPQRITLPAGLAATVATNEEGTLMTAMVINLRPTVSEAGTLTVGIVCR